MRVSFDLDDTLFVCPHRFRTENKLKFPLNLIFKERLRYGTIELINTLKALGNEVWIYTTSFRSERYIRTFFKAYGLKIDEIVNGERHKKEIQRNKKEPMPSKYPSHYRINIHVDDDISVYNNGQLYGFNVFLIGEQDDKWTDKIIDFVESKSKLYTK
ncbi:MAG: HAD family hydrolase [Ruminococcus sp.]|nr:HAD family hydrolase [Ruminococcus sp.]